MPASVVLLPLPAGPVRSNRPWFVAAIRFSAESMPSENPSPSSSLSARSS